MALLKVDNFYFVHETKTLFKVNNFIGIVSMILQGMLLHLKTKTRVKLLAHTVPAITLKNVLSRLHHYFFLKHAGELRIFILRKAKGEKIPCTAGITS
jgi:hypothetical protein